MYISLLVCQKNYHISTREKKADRRSQASLYSHEPVNKRLKSGNSFVHTVTPLDTNHPVERLRAWTHHLRSVPQKFKSIPSEDLGPGSEASWLHWKCLNSLRTGMGRCKSNILNGNTPYVIVVSRHRLWTIC